MASYKEANRPNNYVSGKKHLAQTGNFPNQITTTGSTKMRIEAIEKLEKIGVTLFLPDKNKGNLDWVISSF